MKRLIKSTNLKEAHLMDFFGVMNVLASFLKEEDLEALKIKTLGDEFLNCFKAFDDAVIQQRKTGITTELLDADNLRDKTFVGFSYALKALTYFPVENVAKAATLLIDVVDKYGNEIQELPQREETAILMNLIGDLKSEKNQQLVTTAGIDAWVEELEKASVKFDQFYIERTAIESEFVVGLAKKERQNMQAVFEKLCRGIEAYAFIEGETAYKPIVNKINTEVGKAKKVIKARKTKDDEL